MKYLIVTTALFLSGCATTVPYISTFPDCNVAADVQGNFGRNWCPREGSPTIHVIDGGVNTGIDEAYSVRFDGDLVILEPKPIS
jgi:hypothetical protein